MLARGGRYRPPGTLTAGQRDGLDARVRNDPRGLCVVYMQCCKHAFRNAGMAKDAFDRVGAARHIRCMLEQGHIARHQCRSKEAEYLPHRKIPRHHREHATDRFITHDAEPRFSRDRLILEISSRVFGVPGAGRRRLLDLRERLAPEFAHLRDHQCGQLNPFLAKTYGDRMQVRTARRN